MKDMNIAKIKKELASYARKIAADKLTVGASGNLSVRCGNSIYIKSSGAFFESAAESDFIKLNLKNPSIKSLKKRPSCEYKLHIACYKKRPDIRFIFHTHPIISTTLYSAGIKDKPLTMEFDLYIGSSIKIVDFAPPGSAMLANKVARKAKNSDSIIIKKHGLVTFGKTAQEAYLRALIIEREAKARFISKLFRVKPPSLSEKELQALVNI